MSERQSSGSLDRRVAERRGEQRRTSDEPYEGEDRRSGTERRIGERRTGVQLKFCSMCGNKIEGIPGVVVGEGATRNVRLCADCARKRGEAGQIE